MASSQTRTLVVSVDGESVLRRADRLATEEPMEIRLALAAETRTVAVTMRTHPDAISSSPPASSFPRA